MFHTPLIQHAPRALVLAIAFAFATPALAQDTDKAAAHQTQAQSQAERTIALLLSDYHDVPTRQALEAVSPKARQILLSFAQDEELFALHRHRALSALAAWPDTEVQHLMFSLLSAPGTSDTLQHHLLGVVAHAFGAVAVPAIEPFLTHDDLQLRLSAVAALATIPHDDAQKVLHRARTQEAHPVVVERLDQALQRVR